MRWSYSNLGDVDVVNAISSGRGGSAEREWIEVVRGVSQIGQHQVLPGYHMSQLHLMYLDRAPVAGSFRVGIPQVICTGQRRP